MNNLRLLLKAQLMGAFGINAALHSKDKKLRRSLFYIGGAVFFCFAFSLVFFYVYCSQLTAAGAALGVPELAMGVMFGTASALCLMTTIYKGWGTLFMSQDYETLMPLPVKTWELVASKLAYLYMMNMGFTLLCMVPAFVTYALATSPPPLFYLYALLATLLLPVIPIVIGTLGGLVIALISSKFKKNAMVNLLLIFALLIGIMAVSFSLDGLSPEDFADLSSMLYQQMNHIYPLSTLFLNGICQLSFPSVFGFIGLNTLVFGLFAYVTGKKYVAIHSNFNTSRARNAYQAGAFAPSTPLRALYKRELRRYFASPIYVTNTGIGMVMLLLGSVGLLVSKDVVLSAFEVAPGSDHLIALLAPIFMAGFVAFCNPASVSISLEGKTFPVLKGLPLSPMTIFTAKSMVSLTLTVPTILLCTPILYFALSLNLFTVSMCLLLPLGFALLTPLYGLVVNLYTPNFDWINEMTVVKQSLGSMLGMFGCTALALLMGFGLPLLPPNLTQVALLLCCVVVYGLAALLWRFLKTRGASLFYQL